MAESAKAPGGLAIGTVVALGAGVALFFVVSAFFPAITRFTRGGNGA